MSILNEGPRLAITLSKCKTPRQAASTSARLGRAVAPPDPRRDVVKPPHAQATCLSLTSVCRRRQAARRLEAELRRSSAELVNLRGQLRGAVQDALTDSLTRLANRRSFDLGLAAAVARAGGRHRHIC